MYQYITFNSCLAPILYFRLQEKPQLGFCSSDENTETNSNNVIEVESESPTEPLDRLDEALVTSTQSVVVTTKSDDHTVSQIQANYTCL